MFNTYDIKHESRVVAITKEIEKAISPDKVTEMYDAIREQVEKDILRKIIVKDNQMNGVIVEYSKDFSTNQKKIMYRFTLNGKETIEKETLDDEVNPTSQTLVENMLRIYKDKIAYEILPESIKVIPSIINQILSDLQYRTEKDLLAFLEDKPSAE